MELHYFNYCASNLGVWDRAWFLSKSGAKNARKQRIKEFGSSQRQEREQHGSYGDVEEVQSTTVALTPAGVLQFANLFAVDVGTG